MNENTFIVGPCGYLVSKISTERKTDDLICIDINGITDNDFADEDLESLSLHIEGKITETGAFQIYPAGSCLKGNGGLTRPSALLMNDGNVVKLFMKAHTVMTKHELWGNDVLVHVYAVPIEIP